MLNKVLASIELLKVFISVLKFIVCPVVSVVVFIVMFDALAGVEVSTKLPVTTGVIVVPAPGATEPVVVSNVVPFINSNVKLLDSDALTEITLVSVPGLKLVGLL